ncbi:MAG: hypothetical protein JST37_07255 [Bacteroidetes bacterium]|nr:hypothetical protein [Bacteroidota bacterium]
MDNRRPFSLQGQQQKESSASVFFAIFFGLVMGIFMAILIDQVPSIVVSFSIYHAFLIVMILLMLISDFSSVLLDTSDNTIILPRPVSSKTFYAARTTHILIYIGQIGLSVSLLPILITFYRFGISVGCGLVITSVLSIVLAVTLTNSLYLLIMRFTSEERMKSIINYFQIFISLIVMGGYQLMPRLLSIADFTEVTTGFQWWALLIPPMWFTALIKMAIELSFDWLEFSLAVMAVFGPLTIWKLTTRYLTPYFTAKISDLGTGSSGVVRNVPSERITMVGLNIKSRITRPGLERASFSLVWSALTHDRKLKLRIYPSLGTIVILILVPIFSSNNKFESLQQFIHVLSQSKGHLLAIYACIFVLVTVSSEILFTDEFKASWIFLSAPIERPGAILSGVLKAVQAKFFLPIYSGISVVVLVIWGSSAIVDLIFGASACLFLIILVAIIDDKRLPLSIAPTSRNQTANFSRAIVSMLIIGGMGWGHYLLSKFNFFLWTGIPILSIGTYFLWRIYSAITWEDIRM